MIACWYKTYIRRFGEETKKKKVTCNHQPNPVHIGKHKKHKAKHKYLKNITCEMYSCVCLCRCMNMDVYTVAVSVIFEFSGNKFELGENKFERERETIIFSI